MSRETGRVCLNHTNRPAETRCETCFKPLCLECVFEKGGVHFCSETCARNYNESAGRVSEMEERVKRARRRKLIRRVIALAVLAAAGFFAFKWHSANPEKSREILDAIQQKIKGAGARD